MLTTIYRFAMPALVLVGCARAAPPLFERLDPRATGVAFVNQVREDSALSILNFLNFYDGGGVAAGDVDGDGRPDLYFTSNVGANRLYRNLGDYRFEDVTERAGVADPGGWKTGVTLADVNGDGWLDIFVCAITYLGMPGRNVLYLNNGDGTFTDRTAEYGLTFAGYSTQGLFFDYDRDGDLDLYLLNYSAHSERGPSMRPQREPRHPRAGDRLYRNDGNHFVDVSEQARIYGGVEGYGLGVVASDLNADGCPDLYVANDFQEDDFLYVNNCDGTFTESITQATGHISRSSMGVDAADFNNDGRPDLVVLDMLPEREDVLKTSATVEDPSVYELKVRTGYHYQYARNTLQLNRGGGRFSEIAYLAGVAATDWSWAPLFADLDNDGLKDLFVTNGIYHRPNDMDYITAVIKGGIAESLARGISPGLLRRLTDLMPHIPLANYAFRNNGNLTFTDMATAWGLGDPGFSNGAVYVDLNGSGALDLVANNLNAPAAIYRNHARERNGFHYLAVRLHGAGANTNGIGAKVTIWQGDRQQLLEVMPTRGFQSAVDAQLHFGLGGTDHVDSLVVVWPDGRVQALANLSGDGTITLSQADAAPHHAPVRQAPPSTTVSFTDVTRSLGVDVVHAENSPIDYASQPLLPHLLSTEGPALAVGDVNGDGRDDFYFGGAKWQPGRLFVQLPSGAFRLFDEPAIRADSLSEDIDAAFFDADGDRDLDLYVTSGGNEFSGDADPLRDRLYLNDGRGAFRHAAGALPDFFHNGSCVVPGDFDGDGDLDLFVGTRVVSRQYGTTPRSYLLANDGSGRFADVTLAVAPALAQAGMVTSAAWLDYDHDGALDLIVAGEWMPVGVFRQEQGRFVERTREAGLSGTTGWWSSVTAADLNGDGRLDLVLGNHGLNSYIHASDSKPARLYVGDFFANGTPEQILTFYKGGVSYPLAGRDELLGAMPQLKRRYPTYAAFGASRIEDILPASELRRATVLEARDLATSIALNRGNGTFDLRPLPAQAQFAPVHASVAGDFDGDGTTDLLLAGNFFDVPPVQGRYDASYGLLLSGDGKGGFVPVDMASTGLTISGQVRHLALLGRGRDRLILAARNGDRLLLLQVQR